MTADARPRTRLDARFRDLGAQCRPAFVAYIMASDPERWKKYHTPLIVGGMSTVGVLGGYLAVSSNVERARRLVRTLRGHRSRGL